MITYVNTVLVSNANGAVVTAAPAAASSLNTPSADAGKFVVMTMDPDVQNPYLTAATAATAKTMRIGLVTAKNMTQHNANGSVSYQPIVKWSNVINADSIKSYNTLTYTADTEDAVTIDFTEINDAVLSKFAQGGKRVIVRLTFKDLPTRYRKWTESYEYVTAIDETAASLAENIAKMINKEWKRARVVADGTTTEGKLVLTAMPYDDDDNVDTINWAAKVRFNANVYYTDPAAEGWEANNKNFPAGVKIEKVPGKQYAASAKLVRDRESQAMGYQGILNRGEGTWPIIKPEMQTDLSKHYDAATIEFENTYRAADDIFRKTKQTVEIYGVNGTLTGVEAIISAFVNGQAA